MLTGNSLCWVVDPNYGTSDFVRGFAGSAVSVGLLQGNMPVLGVVHAPVTAKGESDCIALPGLSAWITCYAMTPRFESISRNKISMKATL